MSTNGFNEDEQKKKHNETESIWGIRKDPITGLLVSTKRLPIIDPKDIIFVGKGLDKDVKKEHSVRKNRHNKKFQSKVLPPPLANNIKKWEVRKKWREENGYYNDF